MSNAGLSTAAVIKVKGVSLNYLQFLWTNIQDIRKSHAEGDYATALDKLTGLISYLPESIKEKHRQRCIIEIPTVMRNIASSAYDELKAIPDLYLRGITRNRVLQTYCRVALLEEIDSLTTDLNKIGYMENIRPVQEGEMDEDRPEWMERQAEEQKEKTASGTMD